MSLAILVGILGISCAVSCTINDGEIGSTCSSVSDCAGGLQCVDHTCAAKCRRATDCGDGFACNASGECTVSTGHEGDSCIAEVDCGAGLACHLDATAPTTGNPLGASCGHDQGGHDALDSCAIDDDCRNGTCALGHCVDLCRTDLDCPESAFCTTLPRIEVSGAPTFLGCLANSGIISWSVPVSGPVDDLIIPVPGIARSIALTMTVDDPDEEVGATRVVAPDGTLLYTTPLLPADLYTELVRHQPALGSSVLMMPSSIDTPIQAGAYEVDVSSLRTNGSPGTSTPHVVAAVKTDDLATLDLHFYFLDLTDHPCRAAFNDVTLNASLAPTSNVFQTIFLSSVQTLLDTAGVSLNNVTYDDLVGHPDLDALESVDLSSLLSLGEDRSGVNVFFVRSIAPAGMQAIVDGTPGSPRKAGAGPGGVVIGIDTLCYRDWTRMAHITAHAIARHMGLYRNREPDGGLDPISDSDATSNNLMFYSENSGNALSPGQRAELRLSLVLP